MMQRIHFSIPWPLTGSEMRELFSFASQVSFVSYLGFYLVETLSPGFVSPFFNLNIILWSTISTSILSALWPMIVPAARNVSRPSWPEYVWAVVFALGAMAAVWYKTDLISQPVKLIAPLAGLAVLGLSLLVYYSGDEDSSSS